MTFEQKKARAIALMDSKKMWRSNYAPPLLRILWRLGIRLPPLPFRHCCKVSDEAAFCLIQRPYISKTLLTRRISPRGSP
nr:DUF6404 family protein [Escherichia coli]